MQRTVQHSRYAMSGTDYGVCYYRSAMAGSIRGKGAVKGRTMEGTWVSGVGFPSALHMFSYGTTHIFPRPCAFFPMVLCNFSFLQCGLLIFSYLVVCLHAGVWYRDLGYAPIHVACGVRY